MTAAHIFKKGSTENVIWVLDPPVYESAKLRENLTDHGSQFGSLHKGESNFDAHCQQRIRIRHTLGGISKPTTLRMIECWFRTRDLGRATFQLRTGTSSNTTTTNAHTRR